jgi:hypothetical protein
VECKSWKVPVSKLHVLALREIVADIGADRGILMTERGFQSGAQEAARLTNVELTSLATLEVTAGYDLGMAQLRTIVKRVERCRERYWNLDKETRVDYDLRPNVGMSGYSGRSVLEMIDSALNTAFRGCFPIEAGGELAHIIPDIAMERIVAETPRGLVEYIEVNLAELERRLDAAELATRHDPKPAK